MHNPGIQKSPTPVSNGEFLFSVMLKKTFIFTTLVTLGSAALSTPVKASPEPASNFYITGSYGYSKIDDVVFNSDDTVKLDPGTNWEVGLGYKINQNLRAEITYDVHRSNSNKYRDSQLKFDNTISSVVGNLYYDFANKSKWTPFFGVGIGTANVSKRVGDNPTMSVFTYGAQVGVSRPISDRITSFVKASYRGTSRVKTPGINLAEVYALGFVMGARYSF